MKTTIVIPNYNGLNYLKDCLASLKKCKPDDFKVIVVDNGSTDGSVDFLKSCLSTVETVFLNENTGFAKAVNTGLRKVSTEYALLLNNDVIVEDNFVYEMEKAIERYPGAFSVNAKMVAMHNKNLLDGAGDLYCALGWAFALGKGKNRDTHYNRECQIFSACGGASIYRMDILKKIGLFDENHFAYLEDVDLGFRAKIYGYCNYYTPFGVCYHVGSGYSGSRYNEFKVKLSSRNNVYLILKNMPVLQLLINLPFLLLGFLIKTVFFCGKRMGGLYLMGCREGFSLFFSQEGRKHKVVFHLRHLKNYIKIQLELWWNVVRRFIG